MQPPIPRGPSHVGPRGSGVFPPFSLAKKMDDDNDIDMNNRPFLRIRDCLRGQIESTQEPSEQSCDCPHFTEEETEAKAFPKATQIGQSSKRFKSRQSTLKSVTAAAHGLPFRENVWLC